MGKMPGASDRLQQPYRRACPGAASGARTAQAPDATIGARRSAMQSSFRHTGARAALRALEWLAWIVFFAFAVAFLALRLWLLPQIERHQQDVVDALQRAIGLPVTIGSLSAEWDGLHPRLTVTNLRVADRDGRQALLLPVVEPVIGWSSLLAGELP